MKLKAVMSKTTDYRKTSELKLWEDNPRNIKPKDFERLKKQIQELGQYKPLLITEDGTVIGGNMRLRAYMDLGIEDIWVSVVNPKDENQMLAYALSDNDRAGFYDDDLLANLSSAYPDFEWENYAVDLAPPTTLDLILKNDEVVEDEVPELSQEEPVSKLGEVYQLGRHKLMCGDSTKIEDVEELMNGQKADMVFTDPPYGVDLKFGKGDGNGLANKNNYHYIKNDDSTQVAKDIFNYVSTLSIPVIYWGANYFTDFLPPSRCWIAWYKKEDLPSDDFCDTELAYTNLDKHTRTFSVNWKGMIKEGETGQSRVHPNQKPILLATEVIKYAGNHNNILDLFGGSGSTLIACEQLNRTCYMMELDPKYCDVIRKRYAKFIGKEDTWEKSSPRI